MTSAGDTQKPVLPFRPVVVVVVVVVVRIKTLYSVVIFGVGSRSSSDSTSDINYSVDRRRPVPLQHIF